MKQIFPPVNQCILICPALLSCPEKKTRGSVRVCWQRQKEQKGNRCQRKRQRASVSEREEAEWELESARRGIVMASVFGDRPGPRMCPWLLLCVSALPGWHQWHGHFPAAPSQSWVTAALPGANLHTHRHTATTTHYLSVFPLSRPDNRLCVSLSRPGLSEPYDPGRASKTVLLLCNHTPPAKTAHVHSMFPAQQFLR